MKRFFNVRSMVLVGLLSLVAWNAAEATSFYIADEYIGGNTNGIPGKYLHNDGDVVAGVGRSNDFDIDGMNVYFGDDGTLRVDVQTDYNGTNLGTRFGDLFISTDGWTPYGDNGYREDVASTGTVWEYVFDVSNGNLYDITNDQDRILLSDDVAQSNWSYYRHGQEVEVNSLGLTAATTGGTAGRGRIDGIMNYSMEFGIAGLGFDPENIGFHWAMTCGNDVIEGGTAPVPEPATMVLLALGFVGMAATRLRVHRG